MKIKSFIFFIILTIPFFFLSHYLAVFPHEFSHSTVATLLGFKSNLFNITYGGTSLPNLLLLVNIDEHVNYYLMYLLGYRPWIALVAFAGPGIANGLMFILSWWLLQKNYVKEKKYLYYFIFLFNLMNLGNFYAYVPIRSLSQTANGDMFNLAFGLNISEWWIYIFGTYLVVFLIWHFFTHTLTAAYKNLNLSTTSQKSFLMTLCVLILFGFFGIPGLIYGGLEYGDIAFFLSVTSYALIPAMIFILWPTREWVKRKMIGEQHA